MKTNKQTTSEQFLKESLILKGVATNVLAMQFPKFENLIEMFDSFDYTLKINPKLFESENSVFAFFQKYKEIKFAFSEFEYNLGQRNSAYAPICVFSGILKKIVLCENIISYYSNEQESNESYHKQTVNFDKNDARYLRIIDFLSERRNVLAPNLPIFSYEDKTYSIGEQEFKNENELYEYFYHTGSNTIFVYQIKIHNDNSITVRNCPKVII
jgi:hypothetical protein